MTLKVNVDLSQLADTVSPKKLERLGIKAAHDLALLTQAKLVELGNQRLHTTRELFVSSLTFNEIDGVYVLSLPDDLSWINDGREPFNMIPGLVNGPKAKTAKDGHRYNVIPFKNTAGETGPTKTAAAQMDIVNSVKSQLKKQGISWAGIEKDDQGRPLLGKIRSIKLQTPNKTKEGPYQGQGQLGQPRQGSAWAEPANQPFLGGAAIYQNEVTNKKGEKEVKRSVITFRTASEKQLGLGMWDHPGNERTSIFEDAYGWALQELHTNIIPNLMEKLKKE